MNILTDIFYSLSTMLLIPDMVALLILLIISFWKVGTMLARFRARWRIRENRTRCEEYYNRSNNTEDISLNGGGILSIIAEMRERKDDLLYLEKLIVQVKNSWKSECDNLEMLVRFGPSFGLMGTLIPLGPALLGLARGNLEMMAGNLIIAFSTTVVGLLTGVIGLLLLSICKRWHRNDLLLLNFVYERLKADQEESVQEIEKGDDEQIRR